jgi:hypothetical protein
MRTSTSCSHLPTSALQVGEFCHQGRQLDAGQGALNDRVQAAARCISSPSLSTDLSDPSLASRNASAGSVSSHSTSLDSLESCMVRNVAVLDPTREGPARRVDTVAQRAMAQVAKAYHTPAGLVSWLRSHIFLGPQKSRREEMARKKEVRLQIKKHRRSKADPGTTTVITTSTLSQIAGAVGLAATMTQFGLEFFKVSSAVTLMSKTICPALTIAESAFVTVTSAMRIVRQTRLKNAAAKALDLFETDPAQARARFVQLVGASGSERAEKMRALRVSLGQAETETIMVIATTLDEAVKAGADESQLNEIAALGLATLKRSATQHLISAICALLVNIALVAVSVVILLNPFLAPLALIAVALSVLNVVISTHRGIQDQSLVLGRLGLPSVQPPAASSSQDDPLDGLSALFETPHPSPEDPALVA